MLYKNPNAMYHHDLASRLKQSDSDESPEARILKNSPDGSNKNWIFQGYLFFCSDGRHTGESYEAEVRATWAVVEQQYLPKILFLRHPAQRISIFYHHDSVAETDRDVLKLPVQGYVQVNSASRRLLRKWIGAAELDWAKVHGGILYDKFCLLDSQDSNPETTKRLLLRHGLHKHFQVHGTAWTFSGTVYVDS